MPGPPSITPTSSFIGLTGLFETHTGRALKWRREKRIRARHGLGKRWTTLRVAGCGRGMASETVDDAARRRMRARHGLGKWWATLRVAGCGRGMASPLLETLAAHRGFEHGRPRRFPHIANIRRKSVLHGAVHGYHRENSLIAHLGRINEH